RAFPRATIVGSGYSYLQEFLAHAGAANIRDGRISVVGVGRATLAQPDFVRQIQDHGKLDRKRICRTFSYCTALMRSKHNELGQFATGCPPFDKEGYGAIWEQAKELGSGGRRQEAGGSGQEPADRKEEAEGTGQSEGSSFGS